MDFTTYTNLSLSTLKTNKVRSLLTMLGIIIGVASVILLISIGSGLQNFVTDQFASLGSNTLWIMPGKIDIKHGPRSTLMSTSKFELSDVSDLTKGSTSIKDATPMIQGFGTFTYKDKSSATEVWGVWENYFSITNFESRLGRIISQNDVERSRKYIVLGDKPAKDLFGKTVSPIGKKISMNDIQFEVVGVLKSKGGGGAMGSADDFTAIPLSTSMRQFDRTRPYMIFVEAVDSDHIDQAKIDTVRILSKRLKDDEFTVLEQTQLLETISQFLGVITAALGGIASISLLVGGIGIMNIMLVSVTERTREIGLRKAVGATQVDILLQFLLEAIMLSLVGGSIGILLGAIGAFAATRFIQTEVTWWSVVLAFGFSGAVGVIFGVAPAIRASRLDPIEALRYE